MVGGRTAPPGLTLGVVCAGTKRAHTTIGHRAAGSRTVGLSSTGISADSAGFSNQANPLVWEPMATPTPW
ncbi:hypothetical protein GCM10009634_26620 [Saccharothrix xinjiangensis]